MKAVLGHFIPKELALFFEEKQQGKRGRGHRNH